MCVLVGANGAGKTTTLKVLMNLERADAGTAEILGLDTVRRGALARAQVGYVSVTLGAGVRATGGREAQWTLVGDQQGLLDRLTLAGALVREVQPVGLEDATLALLAGELSK